MNWMGGAKARMKKYIQEKQRKKQLEASGILLSTVPSRTSVKKKPISVEHVNIKKVVLETDKNDTTPALDHLSCSLKVPPLPPKPDTIPKKKGPLIQLSSDSAETPSPPPQIVHHKIQFIDNGVDRTDEVYKAANIQYIPSSTPPKELKPILEFSPSSSDQSNDHSEDLESQLWEAIENQVDLFSAEFQSLFTSISPAHLLRFGDNTIQLLLEICYSYLSHSDINLQLHGINILDSLITFVLSNNNHSTEASFQEIYQRLIQTPPFEVLTSSETCYESHRATLVHLYRKLMQYTGREKEKSETFKLLVPN